MGFGDSRRRAIYFQAFGEKGNLFSRIWGEHNFGGGGVREQGAEEKHFRELGRKVMFLSGSREQRPPPPWGPHLNVSHIQWWPYIKSMKNHTCEKFGHQV